MKYPGIVLSEGAVIIWITLPILTDEDVCIMNLKRGQLFHFKFIDPDNIHRVRHFTGVLIELDRNRKRFDLTKQLLWKTT